MCPYPNLTYDFPFGFGSNLARFFQELRPKLDRKLVLMRQRLDLTSGKGSSSQSQTQLLLLNKEILEAVNECKAGGLFQRLRSVSYTPPGLNTYKI